MSLSTTQSGRSTTSSKTMWTRSLARDLHHPLWWRYLLQVSCLPRSKRTMIMGVDWQTSMGNSLRLSRNLRPKMGYTMIRVLAWYRPSTPIVSVPNLTRNTVRLPCLARKLMKMQTSLLISRRKRRSLLIYRSLLRIASCLKRCLWMRGTKPVFSTMLARPRLPGSLRQQMTIRLSHQTMVSI